MLLIGWIMFLVLEMFKPFDFQHLIVVVSLGFPKTAFRFLSAEFLKRSWHLGGWLPESGDCQQTPSDRCWHGSICVWLIVHVFCGSRGSEWAASVLYHYPRKILERGTRLLQGGRCYVMHKNKNEEAVLEFIVVC